MKKLLIALLLVPVISFASTETTETQPEIQLAPQCMMDLPDAMGVQIEVGGKAVNAASYYCNVSSNYKSSTLRKHNASYYLTVTFTYKERLQTIHVNLNHKRMDNGIYRLHSIGEMGLPEMPESTAADFYKSFEHKRRTQ